MRSTYLNPYVLKLIVKFSCFGGFIADEVHHIKKKTYHLKKWMTNTIVFVIRTGNLICYILYIDSLTKDKIIIPRLQLLD